MMSCSVMPKRKRARETTLIFIHTFLDIRRQKRFGFGFALCHLPHRYLRAAARILISLWLDGRGRSWWKIGASDVRVGEPMLVSRDVAAVALSTPSPYVAISRQDVIYPTRSNIKRFLYMACMSGWRDAIFSGDRAVFLSRQVR